MWWIERKATDVHLLTCSSTGTCVRHNERVIIIYHHMQLCIVSSFALLK